MNLLLIILIAIIIIILVAIVAIYNGLVTARNKVKNAWAQIDVHKRICSSRKLSI